MLSKVSERTMRAVRVILAIGWLVLIASLFYDPVTLEFTQADNLDSPFHIHPERKVMVQGVPLPQEPYHMSPRIFWTMIIPIAPIAIMLLGHEFWRRVCPLSFFSQIARYTNKHRYLKTLNRKTGKIETKLNLVARDSWLQKNNWYVQFWLLFFALCMRILFVNSDRTALAIFLIVLISSATIIGYLWGGKTWCNYICPVAVVQKIYTEPGGVLESKAHIEKPPISQSMCREPGIAGDKSICVGCTAECPDIDLESSYWKGIENPQRRFVYYGFMGLVIGFYTYYYLYSGTWDYYFSGAWTHEADQVRNIFKPGLYLFDQPIAFIPKLLAVPLVLGAFVFLSFYVGVILEKIYRWFLVKINRPLHNKDVLHHMFAVYAFATINIFYVFGGRPNIKMLSEEGQEIMAILILLISSVWLNNALSRSYKVYQRESMVSSLLKQLKKLSFNFKEILDGGSLESLSYDEIYILGKTLPGVTRNQKMDVYKNILHDGLNTGGFNSSESLTLMRDIRSGMGISDDEHNSVLQELGVENVELFDPDRIMTHEIWIRENNYKKELNDLLNKALEQNIKVKDYLQQHQQELEHLQALYNIEEQTHNTILSELVSDNRVIIEKASGAMDQLMHLSGFLHTLLQHKKNLIPENAGYFDVLYGLVLQRRQRYAKYLLGVIVALGDCQEARIIAHNLLLLLGKEINQLLNEENWHQRMELTIYDVLTGVTVINREKEDHKSDTKLPSALQYYSYTAIIRQAPEIKHILQTLTHDEDAMTSIYALLALSTLNTHDAKMQSQEMKEKLEGKHWLYKEAIQYLTGSVEHEQIIGGSFNVDIYFPNGNKDSIVLIKPIISVGKDLSNDISLYDQYIAPYQAFIKRSDSHNVYLELLDRSQNIYINERLLTSDTAKLSSGDKIRFGQGVSLIITWESPNENSHYYLQHFPTFEKLIWLKQVPIFSHLDLYNLADIAQKTDVAIFRRDSVICKQGEHSRGAYILHTGTADVLIDSPDHQQNIVNHLTDGAVIGELSVITGSAYSATVKVSSSSATVLLISRDALEQIIDNNILVTKSLLAKVAEYVSKH